LKTGARIRYVLSRLGHTEDPEHIADSGTGLQAVINLVKGIDVRSDA